MQMQWQKVAKRSKMSQLMVCEIIYLLQTRQNWPLFSNFGKVPVKREVGSRFLTGVRWHARIAETLRNAASGGYNMSGQFARSEGVVLMQLFRQSSVITHWPLGWAPMHLGWCGGCFQKITGHLRQSWLLSSNFRLPFALSPLHCKNCEEADMFRPFYVEHKVIAKSRAQLSEL